MAGCRACPEPELGARQGPKKLSALRAATLDFLESNQRRAAATKKGWADDEAQPPAASEPPLPLLWYLDCKRYGVLLVAGGLLDQPTWAMVQMRTAGVAYDEELELQDELERLRQGQTE